MDKFISFDDLKRQFNECVDFCIRPLDRGGAILILAPHGGGIEPGTSELARAIAGSNYSLYLFEGIKPKLNKVLHITSTNFDEPCCVNLISKFQKALAIHGCDEEESMIYIGGRDHGLRDMLISALNEKNYPVKLVIRGCAGNNSKNICNRTRSGSGVQIELSQGFRRTLFKYWRTPKTRIITTEIFSNLATTIRDVLGSDL
jgi:phage replication-related protein YjqB (UPF0714/DUF867 family)